METSHRPRREEPAARPPARSRLLAPALALGLAQAPLAEAGPPADAFAPLEFLVGSCWVGTFPDGKATDEPTLTPLTQRVKAAETPWNVRRTRRSRQSSGTEKRRR